ncbi:MAG: Ig-like domain repeat protein [Microthrixaceae bacterium]
MLEHTFTVETDPLLTVAVVSGPAAGSTIATSWAPRCRGRQPVLGVATLNSTALTATCPTGAATPRTNAYLSLYDSYTDLADGTLRVQAEATGGARPVGQATFTVETKAPETTITAKPLQNANSANATFEFNADEPATFECRIDGGTYQPCISPWGPSGLADGPHEVEIRATDSFGNVDGTPAAWSWSVDTVAPVIIDLDGPPPATIDPDAVLTFDANEPATFECQLNDSAWTNCNSRTVTYAGLPDDSYTFNVRATDLAGNLGEIAARSWVLGTDPPETVIDSGPDALVNTSDATITFSSPDAGVTYECRLGAEDFAPCNSPRTFNGLGDDSYTFAVRAVNAGGLADPTPASTTWTVDTIAPTVAIDSGPSGTVGVGPATFTFSPSEAAALFCSLDGGVPEACTSPRYLGVLAGTSHTFSVYATDPAGNTGPTVSQTWMVDEVAPVVTITSQPADYADSGDATVGYTVDDAEASVQCSIDGQALGAAWPTPAR